MKRKNKVLALTFFTGLEAFHALVHTYLGLTKTNVKKHPVELVGLEDTPKFHLIAAFANAAIAIGLAIKTQKLMSEGKLSLPRSGKKMPDQRQALRI